MKRFLMASVCALSLAACSNSAGKFEGSWVNVHSAKSTLDITENGSNLLVATTHPDPFFGKMETHKYVGAIKGGALVVQMDFPVTFVIDKTSGHLTGAGTEYKRPGK